MKLLKKAWLQLVILAVPFSAVALLWDKLPDKMPIHWNARGQVDGYESKVFGAFFVPVLNLAMAALLAVLPLIDPKLQSRTEEVKNNLWRIARILRLALTGFLSFTSLAMLAASTGLFKDGVQFSYAVYTGVSFLFIIMGNFLTKLRPNYFMGIRTPWTLSSDEVWTKTHRLGGPLMVTGGFLMLVLLLAVPLEKYAYFVVLPVALGLTTITSTYSYLLHRKLAGKQSMSR
jgi:uncharacterized membrane protein